MAAGWGAVPERRKGQDGPPTPTLELWPSLRAPAVPASDLRRFKRW